MNYLGHPPGLEISECGSTSGLDEQPYGRRKWPIHYDSIEPLAIATDVATIVFASVLSSLSYHFQESGAPLDLSKSVGAGILVSALFISLLKIRGMYRPAALLVLRHQIRAVLLSWISVFLLLAATV